MQGNRHVRTEDRTQDATSRFDSDWSENRAPFSSDIRRYADKRASWWQKQNLFARVPEFLNPLLACYDLVRWIFAFPLSNCSLSFDLLPPDY